MTSAKRSGGRGGKRRPPTPPHTSLAELYHERPPIPLVIAVVLTAVLEVLDITIVNVSIPNRGAHNSAWKRRRSVGSR